MITLSHCPLLALSGALAFCTTAFASAPSDCLPGSQDSTCVIEVDGGAIGHIRQSDHKIFEGPLAGVPATGNHYWGFDFKSPFGVYPKTQRSMYVNRSESLIRITLSFDIPNGNCGHNCMPGVEFKLDNWMSYFPNIIAFNGRAQTSVEIPPNHAYGWVIGLWRASNPTLTVSVEDSSQPTMEIIGLPMDPSHVTATPGQDHTCTCPDGSLGQCRSATTFSTGYVGPWYEDGYTPVGQTTTCPGGAGINLLRK